MARRPRSRLVCDKEIRSRPSDCRPSRVTLARCRSTKVESLAGATNTSLSLGRVGRLRIQMKLRGIHHITAIAGDPQHNVDFYTHVLGLRFAKRTVNFDDPSTYHLY